jgi:hypothetical protein
MSPQDLLLSVFCLVDNEIKALQLDSVRQRGPDPVGADREVIAIELVGEPLGLDRDTRLFWHFRRYHASESPGLTRVHRTTFARQAASLWRVRKVLQHRLAERRAGVTADWLVDSLPLPVCRFGRGGFCTGFRGHADFGYDPVQKQAYDGFRLHLRTRRAGVILAYELAASAADTAVLFDLRLPPGTTGIGDRNYWSPPVQAELAGAGVRLLHCTRASGTTPSRRGRGRWAARAGAWRRWRAS